nr:NADPH:quinone oxidoreductase family protein [Brevundimonas diminuta]
MRRIESRQAGGPETLVLAEAPGPTPTGDEVIIDVAVCGINYPDVLIIQDLYQVRPPRPFAPGSEVSGVVTAIGPDVGTLRIGDRVMAAMASGGLAEQVAVAERFCVRLPDAMPFDDAGAFMMTYGTSFFALSDRGRLKAGETLLVLGASGGVGMAAIQIARAIGARVVAAASSQDKMDAALAAGAETGVVYPTGPLDADAAKAFGAALKAALGPGGADVVYDPVGGALAEPALRAIAWRGRYLVVGFAGGVPRPPLNLALLKQCDIVGVWWGAHVERESDAHQASMRALFELYGEGALKPLISARHTLEDAPAAIQALADRKVLGKIIVEIAPHRDAGAHARNHRSEQE